MSTDVPSSERVPALRRMVTLRPERCGAVIVSYADSGKYSLLSSFEAFILSLFDGTRTLRDIVALLASLEDSPSLDVVRHDVSNLAADNSDFIELLSAPEEHPRFDVAPRDLLSRHDLFTRPARPERPLWIDLYLTRNCNLKCIYCFADAKHGTAQSTPSGDSGRERRLFNIAGQIADLGVKRLLVTGGEPTMSHDLLELIQFFTQRKIEVVLATNACLITGIVAERLARAGLREIQVKLDASSPDLQDRLSGVKGTYQQLIRGIRTLREQPFSITVAIVVTALNVDEIPEVIRVCAELGVDKVSPRIYAAGIWALAGRGGAYLNPSPEAIELLQQKLKEAQGRYRSSLDIASFEPSRFKKKTEREVPTCPGLVSSCTILDNGSVVPCETLADYSEEFVIGDMRVATLAEIWNSLNAQKWVERMRPPVGVLCRSCDEFERCKGGCAWKSYVAYGNWAADPFCTRAPVPSLIPFPTWPSAPRVSAIK